MSFYLKELIKWQHVFEKNNGLNKQNENTRGAFKIYFIASFTKS